MKVHSSIKIKQVKPKPHKCETLVVQLGAESQYD